MSSDEAHSCMKPRNENSIQRKNQSCLPAAGFLLIILTILSVYSLLACKYNYDARMKTQFAYREMETMKGVQEEVLLEIKYLRKENKAVTDQYKVVSDQNKEILKQLEELKKKNEELQRINQNLSEDNIALQNSLKKAASVGIKPQNFTNFNGITSRGEVEKGRYLGKFLGTAYTPSSDECGNNKGITHSGHPIIPGISIAIDKKYWPFGTVFYIKGLGYAVAMDTGSAIKGKNRFDFAVFDKNFAKTLGTKYWEVFLVKMGNGKVGTVSF